MNYNRVILGGHLTRDPEAKSLQSGTSVCNFGMAINRKWRTPGGEDREEVVFVDCEAWEKTGESIAKFFVKGKPILIEGRLKFEQWEQDGHKRSKLKVTVDSFRFCGGDKGEAGGEAAAPAKKPAAAPVAGTTWAPAIDDDIPF